jgi:hypothetical protein
VRKPEQPRAKEQGDRWSPSGEAPLQQIQDDPAEKDLLRDSHSEIDPDRPEEQLYPRSVC